MHRLRIHCSRRCYSRRNPCTVSRSRLQGKMLLLRWCGQRTIFHSACTIYQAACTISSGACARSQMPGLSRAALPFHAVMLMSTPAGSVPSQEFCAANPNDERCKQASRFCGGMFHSAGGACRRSRQSASPYSRSAGSLLGPRPALESARVTQTRCSILPAQWNIPPQNLPGADS